MLMPSFYLCSKVALVPLAFLIIQDMSCQAEVNDRLQSSIMYLSQSILRIIERLDALELEIRDIQATQQILIEKDLRGLTRINS